MQKDSIYCMWFCYSVWRDCKINYFSCQQGWSPIVKTQLQISMNCSTKPRQLRAALGAVGTPCAAKGTQSQRDTVTVTSPCHSSPENQRCSTRAHPKAAGRAHPAARHRWDAPARKIPTLGIHKRVRAGILLHLGFENKRMDLESVQQCLQSSYSFN